MTESRYTGKTYIGSGGMASVYKAYDTVLERDVAIKEIAEPLRDNIEIRGMFLGEARKMAQIRHLNVVQVYDVIDDKDVPTIILEYLAGGSLATRLGTGSAPAEEVLNIVEQVISGLQAIHEAGVVHRDVKPENILEGNSLYKITDFGVAMSGNEDILPFVTNRYAAPEVLIDPGNIGPNSDLYSVGIMAIELMLGTQRFEDAVKEAITGDQQLNLANVKGSAQAFWQQWIASPAELPLLSSIDHSISPEIAQFLAHLTRRDPAARPANCADVLTEVAKIRHMESRRVSSDTEYDPKLKRLMEKKQKQKQLEEESVSAGKPAPKKKWPLWFTLTLGVVGLLILAVAALMLMPASGPPRFRLELVTSPPGASVTINGKTLESGPTPVSFISTWGEKVVLALDGTTGAELVIGKEMPGLSETTQGKQLEVTLPKVISINGSSEAAALLKGLATNAAQLDVALEGVQLREGRYTVAVGTPLHFLVQAQVPGMLAVLHLGSDDAATLIYPSPQDGVKQIGLQGLMVGPELDLVATEPVGREWMVFVLSNDELLPPDIQGFRRVGGWGRRYAFDSKNSPGRELTLWLMDALKTGSVSALVVETEVVFRLSSQ
ncbi:serine/threonine protein kinase [bacterium]|nr:serine/threonine protein kinase [bacterium]